MLPLEFVEENSVLRVLGLEKASKFDPFKKYLDQNIKF